MLFIRSIGRLASTDSAAAAAAAASASTPSSTSKTPTTTNLITIKDSCLKRLKKILSKPQEEFLRIHVETGGCSGFNYMFEIERKSSINSNEDLVFERENYRVVINKEILPFIKGASIEFNESLIKSSFQVINPIAETNCGCGSSFSVNLDKLHKQQTEN